MTPSTDKLMGSNMSRMTKTEKLALELAAEELREKQAVEMYPVLLMQTLERASKLGWDMAVVGGFFKVYDRNNCEEFRVSPVFVKHDFSLSDLELNVGLEETRQAEERDRFMKKQAALAKLTKEEKELLGL